MTHKPTYEDLERQVKTLEELICKTKRDHDEKHTREAAERQQAQEALRKSEAQYRLLHDGMRDACVRADLDGTIREFNDAYAQMLGYTSGELKTMNLADITPDKWHAADAGIIKNQVLQNGSSDLYEKEYCRKDGTVFPVELRVILFRDQDGKPSGTWAIIRDITERRQMEKDREMLILELQQVMKKVRVLGGLLPVCASCKKIRNDEEYMKKVEAYIAQNPETSRSLGLCADCRNRTA